MQQAATPPGPLADGQASGQGGPTPNIAMRLEGLSQPDAERLRKEGDRAREAYVRHFYNCDAKNPSLYHLVIDSTTLSPETVVDVIRLVDRAEYKRRQAPPGIRVSTKAFGRDRRLPITNRFRG